VWTQFVSGTGTTEEAVRLAGAGGSFGSSQPLSETGVQSLYPNVAISSRGDVVVSWVNNASQKAEASEQPNGGSFGTPVPISAAGVGQPGPSLAADGQGDVIANWYRFDGSKYNTELAAYDAANPVLQNLSIPGQGTAGSPVAVSVNPVGIWSPVASTSWSFGDGGSASGPSVSHTFAAAGSYPVSVTATDAAGKSTTANGTILIVPASSGGGGSGGGGSSGAGKPTLSALGETNSVFVVGPSSTPLSGQTAQRRHKRGTVFSFRLDQPALVKIAITTKARGRRVGRSCRPDSRKLRHKPRCTRTITLATLVRVAHAGINKVPFSGRIRGRALKPGRYQARFTAIDSAGASRPKTLTFTIVRR